MDDQQPQWWRIALAFVIAPLVPSAMAAATTLFDGLPNGSYPQWVALFVLFGGYPATLVFGLPAFLILRSRLQPRFLYVTFAGGLVAAIPWLLLVLFGSNPDMAMIGEHVTVRDGVKTAWGWIEGLKMVGGVFLWGLVGGSVFWFAAVWRPPIRTQPSLAD